MNLEEIAKSTKTEVILLVNNKGEIMDVHPKETEGDDTLLKKIGVFTSLILNMTSDFFENFFETNVNEITLKSGNKSMFIYKHEENGEKNNLCFFAEGKINTALIGLTLKRSK